MFCTALLYIKRNGGGTHITDFSQLQSLTKASISRLIAYYSVKLTYLVGYFKRMYIPHDHDNPQDLTWHLFRAYCGRTIANYAHLYHR